MGDSVYAYGKLWDFQPCSVAGASPVYGFSLAKHLGISRKTLGQPLSLTQATNDWDCCTNWYCVPCVPPGPSKYTQRLLTFPRHMGVGVGRITFLGIWEDEIIKDATSIGILSASYMLFYTPLPSGKQPHSIGKITIFNG